MIPASNTTFLTSASIPLLAEQYAREAGVRPREISSETMGVLRGYDWPGNVRQLGNVIEQATVLCSSEVIDVRDLPAVFEASIGKRFRSVGPCLGPAANAGRGRVADEAGFRRQRPGADRREPKGSRRDSRNPPQEHVPVLGSVGFVGLAASVCHSQHLSLTTPTRACSSNKADCERLHLGITSREKLRTELHEAHTDHERPR